MYEINELQKRYKQFEDEKIEWIAKYESRGLRNEVIPILIAEIEKRKLNLDLIKWIKAERRKLTTSELRDLKNKVKNLNCDVCGKRNGKLKGYEFTTITGILIDEFVSHYRLIVCEKCGKRKRRNSAIWTTIFGWLSIRGFISIPFVLIDKIKAGIREDKESEKIIEDFIHGNIGEITLGKDSQETIKKLLREFNQIRNEFKMGEE